MVKGHGASKLPLTDSNPHFSIQYAISSPDGPFKATSTCSRESRTAFEDWIQLQLVLLFLHRTGGSR